MPAHGSTPIKTEPYNWEAAVQYHERTKHHFGRFARSLGYMDWATQPNPFRRFDGATLLTLPRPVADCTPPYDQIYQPDTITSQAVSIETVSSLFFYSMALSAWKVYQTNRWSLRVNPSSGNLHPTEAYLLTGHVPGLDDQSGAPGEPGAGIYHYASKEHALERRAVLDQTTWLHLTESLPQGAMFVGLTSIAWRESWKYGERAYRYCQHDAGHALAALGLSAAMLGWRLSLLPRVSDRQIESLLGLNQPGAWHEDEQERPDLIAAIVPSNESREVQSYVPPDEAIQAVASADWTGRANQLSQDHHPWPVIAEVERACEKPVVWRDQWRAEAPTRTDTIEQADHGATAGQIVRQRRSAVAMDGQTSITERAFYNTLIRLVPSHTATPWHTLPWPARVHLGLFVHRVETISPGLYVLVRNQDDDEALRREMKPNFAWRKPPSCPDDLPFYLLQDGDARRLAAQVSCGQAIASDGAFSLGMLARFEPTLRDHGAFLYRHLFWETGVIGQVLYLEAEAIGIRSTGIGCFFDDPVHDVFGLRGHAFQSLYHFTVGGAVDDPRLTSEAPYPTASGDVAS